MNRINTFIFAMMISVIIGQQQPPSADNWKNHPEIIKIRQLYNQIETVSKTTEYKVMSKSVKCYNGAVVIDAALYIDSTTTVRKYAIKGGSGDSVGDRVYYYDSSSILRFIFTSRNAINDTQLEFRMYFDELGRELYSEKRLLKGPGWPVDFPDKVDNPKKDYDNLCGS